MVLIVIIVYKSTDNLLSLSTVKRTFNINSNYYYYYRLETAVPCTDCSGVAFCSVECKKTALNTYHKYECHYLDLLIGSGMSILCFAALRIVSQENVKYFTEGCLENKSFSHHPYRQVYRNVKQIFIKSFT